MNKHAKRAIYKRTEKAAKLVLIFDTLLLNTFYHELHLEHYICIYSMIYLGLSWVKPIPWRMIHLHNVDPYISHADGWGFGVDMAILNRRASWKLRTIVTRHNQT